MAKAIAASLKTVFHLLPNAHLDPVWLWDWREGLNEGVTTSKCMLDLMDEFKSFTFIRGEAALYRHIEEFHPKLFKRIQARVAEGRWDVVGGTWIQPDTNLPSTETLCRHFALAQNYFMERFGVKARAAWATDSFGHSAGLPEILEAAGIEFFACSRPNNATLPLEKPAFWWRGQGGARILSWRIPIGWYGCERDKMTPTLDQYLAEASKWGLNNIAVFYGLGDHGGGSTRRQLAEAAAWAESHQEVSVVHSTLHGYFDALRKELAVKGESFIPEHKGELNFTLRGCYSSAAKFKFKYRQLESDLQRSEAASASINSLLGLPPEHLGEEWESALFNSFHDILPGSSIERAYDEQLAWVGSGLHGCACVAHRAINELAKRIDFSVEIPKGDHPSGVPLIVFNPLPHECKVPLELEASLDYRPVWGYRGKAEKLPWEILDAAGKPVGFQEIKTESDICEGIPWRKRAVVAAAIPPLGWTSFELRWREGAVNPGIPSDGAASSPKAGAIQNAFYKVSAEKGSKFIKVFKDGKPLFGKEGLSVATFEDPFSSWGDIHDEPEAKDISELREIWTVDQVKVLERGPLRATLWVKLKGGSSWLDLAISLFAGREAVDFSARMLFNERAARVKLAMPSCDGAAECQVPGGTAFRKDVKGEVPGGRWAKVSARQPYGFASDSIYNFDARKGLFRATVARSSHYASEGTYRIDDVPEMPVTDCGEYRFKFLLGPADSRIERLADMLEARPFVQTVPPLAGKGLKRTGSLLEIDGGSFKMLALKPALDGKGLLLRVQELSGKTSRLKITLLNEKLDLGEVGAHKIASFRLTKSKRGLKVEEADSVETPKG